jgi:pimeloyl-ACP methyl ester carboxylesterase
VHRGAVTSGDEEQQSARYAVRDGARLVFYEHGSGETTIVFINPIINGLSTFEPGLEQLRQEIRVITVDCRGAG